MWNFFINGKALYQLYITFIVIIALIKEGIKKSQSKTHRQI